MIEYDDKPSALNAAIVETYDKMEEAINDLDKACDGNKRLHSQIFSYYLDLYSNDTQNIKETLRGVSQTICAFIKTQKIVDLDNVDDQHIFGFLETLKLNDGDNLDVYNNLQMIFDLLRWQQKRNVRANRDALPKITLTLNRAFLHLNLNRRKNPAPEEEKPISHSYGLEKITNVDNPIFKQITSYYRYCSQTCGFSPKTMTSKSGYINYFVKFSGITRLEDITNQQICDWVDYQKSRGNCGRSINHRLAQMKVMLRWQRDDNVQMPGLKISRIKMQKEAPARKKYYTRKQINFALLFAERRENLMIRLGFDCGLRIGELTSIKVSDIHGNKIRIIGKGNKLRWVVMSNSTMRHLNRWIKDKDIKDYLWPSVWDAKEHIAQEEVRRSLQEVFAKAGFNDFVPHDLRHSFATELKKLGVPTRKIMLAMGHSSEAITERYLSDLDGITVEGINREIRIPLAMLKVKTFFTMWGYALPKITLKNR